MESPVSRLSKLLIMLSFIPCAGYAVAETVISENYEGVETIRVSTASADVTLIRSTDNLVHLTITHTYNTDSYQPRIRFSNGSLRLKERFRSSFNHGRANWVLAVPDDLGLNVNSGSGDIKAGEFNADLDVSLGSGDVEIDQMRGELSISEGSGNIDVTEFSGRFRARTGSGNITISDSTGPHDLSAGSGIIRVRSFEGTLSVSQGSGDTTVTAYVATGNSRFSSGSGDVEISLAEPLLHDISLSNGSGNVELDYNNHPISGEIEIRARRGSRIRAPITFDEEYIDESSGQPVTVKLARLGNGTNQVLLVTGTGSARIID